MGISDQMKKELGRNLKDAKAARDKRVGGGPAPPVQAVEVVTGGVGSGKVGGRSVPTSGVG